MRLWPIGYPRYGVHTPEGHERHPDDPGNLPELLYDVFGKLLNPAAYLILMQATATLPNLAHRFPSEIEHEMDVAAHGKVDGMLHIRMQASGFLAAYATHMHNDVTYTHFGMLPVERSHDRFHSRDYSLWHSGMHDYEFAEHVMQSKTVADGFLREVFMTRWRLAAGESVASRLDISEPDLLLRTG